MQFLVFVAEYWLTVIYTLSMQECAWDIFVVDGYSGVDTIESIR
jgi:hypothetical protein